MFKEFDALVFFTVAEVSTSQIFNGLLRWQLKGGNF